MKTLHTPDWVAAFRAELPAAREQVYLNTGTAGPMPMRTADAIRAELARELDEGRGNFTGFGRFMETRERVRGLVAELLGAETDEVALTHHTSDGINIVLWGLDWRPGDVVVTTSLEHDAVVVPLALLRDRRGVTLRVVELGRGEDAVERLSEHLDDRVRLVVLSHIVWSTGACLPVAELVARAHAVGARVLVDGAQSAGALPLEVRSLGADYYTVSGQKWICGPEGTGALFVDRALLDELSPTFASYFSAAGHDYRAHVKLHDSARRYEVGMVFRPALSGLAVSLEWLLREVGVARAWTRSLELAAWLRGALGGLTGVEVLSPPELPSSLVAVELSGFGPAHLHALAAQMSAEGVVVRSIDTPPHALRASVGFFNTSSDLERFRDRVARAVADGPDAVPLTDRAGRLPKARSGADET